MLRWETNPGGCFLPQDISDLSFGPAQSRRRGIESHNVAFTPLPGQDEDMQEKVSAQRASQKPLPASGAASSGGARVMNSTNSKETGSPRNSHHAFFAGVSSNSHRAEELDGEGRNGGAVHFQSP